MTHIFHAIASSLPPLLVPCKFLHPGSPAFLWASSLDSVEQVRVQAGALYTRALRCTYRPTITFGWLSLAVLYGSILASRAGGAAPTYGAWRRGHNLSHVVLQASRDDLPGTPSSASATSSPPAIFDFHFLRGQRCLAVHRTPAARSSAHGTRRRSSPACLHARHHRKPIRPSQVPAHVPLRAYLSLSSRRCRTPTRSTRPRVGTYLLSPAALTLVFEECRSLI
ncbi:hypothetical protein EVG20_g9142 [Dentipellis fragilis]|uniref:Uncharacterized protein n=1 Tax=Dentipellis fragilis TaxID=205917 RepID=A0A4Y9Y0A0_9AGAM|nr:hypothetical protein EVG20_g9142 [Dentipellis fragilis]